MMYSMNFVLAVAALGACTILLLIVVVETGGARSLPGHGPSFIYTSPLREWNFTRLSYKPEAIHIKRRYTARSDDSSRRDGDPRQYQGLILTCLIITIILELITIGFIICFTLYACVRRFHRKWRPQNNPETRRAEQVLNSHPQSSDIELGVIHGRSTAEWPLTNHAEDPAPPVHPRRPYSMESNYTGASMPVDYDMAGNRYQSNLPEVNTQDASAAGEDIAEAIVQELYVTESGDIIHAFESETDESESDLDALRFRAEELRDRASHSGCYVPETEITHEHAAEGSDTGGLLLRPVAYRPEANVNHSESLSPDSDTEGLLLRPVVYQPEANVSRSDSPSPFDTPESLGPEVTVCETLFHGNGNPVVDVENGIIAQDWAYRRR
ncbi:hypothetical protein SAMD00023353_3900040 [Rosellinia necatrix]|uniref:Uncharacterized protein n=1 Tax=Rosellinia necatrix TaxID=77044 RepID=A0A1S7UNF4_ROSNE|nr:hypothetical protein SAMD00023353_3900040 [Rosellinia necatrix]